MLQVVQARLDELGEWEKIKRLEIYNKYSTDYCILLYEIEFDINSGILQPNDKGLIKELKNMKRACQKKIYMGHPEMSEYLYSDISESIIIEKWKNKGLNNADIWGLVSNFEEKERVA